MLTPTWYRPASPKRLRLHAWLWGAIELAALWRARWRRRGSGAGM